MIRRLYRPIHHQCRRRRRYRQRWFATVTPSSLADILDDSLRTPLQKTTTLQQLQQQQRLHQQQQQQQQQHLKHHRRQPDIVRVAEYPTSLQPFRAACRGGKFDVSDVVKILRRLNAIDIALYDVLHTHAFVDYLVVATSKSARGIRYMIHNVTKVARQRRYLMSLPHNAVMIHSDPEADWMLAEMGTISVCILTSDARKKYGSYVVGDYENDRVSMDDIDDRIACHQAHRHLRDLLASPYPDSQAWNNAVASQRAILQRYVTGTGVGVGVGVGSGSSSS